MALRQQLGLGLLVGDFLRGKLVQHLRCIECDPVRRPTRRLVAVRLMDVVITPDSGRDDAESEQERDTTAAAMSAPRLFAHERLVNEVRHGGELRPRHVRLKPNAASHLDQVRADYTLSVTWVVGCRSLELAAMFGDVCVTYASAEGDREETLFGVQKIHPVTPSIAVGFAGSIDVGFRLVEDLQRTAWLGKYGRLPEVPDLVYGWADELRAGRYEEAVPPSPARNYGCKLLVLGVSQHASIGNLHDTFGFKLTFRDNVAVPTPIQWSGAIGSGGDVPRYVEALEQYGFKTVTEAVNAGPDRTVFASLMLSLIFTHALQERPSAGVSVQMLGAIITSEGILFGDNSILNDAVPSGSQMTDVPAMPPLARTRQELNALEARYASTDNRPGIATSTTNVFRGSRQPRVRHGG